MFQEKYYTNLLTNKKHQFEREVSILTEANKNHLPEFPLSQTNPEVIEIHYPGRDQNL